MSEPTQNFDDLVVGTVYPPVEYRMTAEQVGIWVEAFEDDSVPAASSGEAPLVPAALTSLYILDAVLKAYPNRPKGNVHAKQEFVWYRPVRVGEALYTEVIVADKWIKRGRRYVQTETRTSNAAGQLVATGRMTSIFAR